MASSSHGLWDLGERSTPTGCISIIRSTLGGVCPNLALKNWNPSFNRFLLPFRFRVNSQCLHECRSRSRHFEWTYRTCPEHGCKGKLARIGEGEQCGGGWQFWVLGLQQKTRSPCVLWDFSSGGETRICQVVLCGIEKSDTSEGYEAGREGQVNKHREVSNDPVG